jgi:membrane protease subunit HflK
MSDPHDLLHSHDHAGHSHGAPEAPLTDPAQESLVRALRSSFNVLRVLMVVLVVLYVFSGVFRVNPGQYGVIARFGKLRETPRPGEKTGPYVFTPGWYAALPEPFDQQITLSGVTQLLTATTFLFAHPDADKTEDLAAIIGASRDLQPGVDGAMLTGDKNLSHGRWKVQYHIEDAAKYVRNVGDTPRAGEALLLRLLETAVVREVAGRTVEEVTRTAQNAVRDAVQARLQKYLDQLETGLTIVQVTALTIEPGAVREAFADVSKAESDRETLQSEARGKAAETLSRAAGGMHAELLALIQAYGAAQLRGESEESLRTVLAQIDAKLLEAEARQAGQVAIKLNEAHQQASEASDRLRGQYAEFTKYLEQRQARPVITLLNLWAQMREEVLGNRENEVFFVPRTGEIEIHTNRDPQRALEREQERVKKRTGRQ